MIIRQKEKQIECIKQHDHAHISGEIATHWREVVDPDVVFGIYEHDRAWIPLDEVVEKDAEQDMPYDFISYPLTPKLTAYTNGVDEVQEQSVYAALLCSKHYCSFFTGSITSEPGVQTFLDQEQQRQESLLKKIDLRSTSKKLAEHFKLLQFCDDLSLYICMNQPGIPKSEEVSWFKDGFTQPFSFAPSGIKAEWINETDIKLEPFPFKEPITISFPVYELPITGNLKLNGKLELEKLSTYTQTVVLR